MKQERKQKQAGRTEEVEDVQQPAGNAELAEKTDQVLDDIDAELEDFDILADLDDVLGTEEEAIEFVSNYRQMGGE